MSSHPRSILVILSACAGMLWGAGGALAATFQVTKTVDTADGACDADCSLREAVLAANALPGADTVALPAGTFALTRDTCDEGDDLLATCQGLYIADALTIAGSGAGATTVEHQEPFGDAMFRVVTTDPVRVADLGVRLGDNPFRFLAITGSEIGGGQEPETAELEVERVQSEADAGVLWSVPGSVRVEDSDLVGGGIDMESIDAPNTATVLDSTVGSIESEWGDVRVERSTVDSPDDSQTALVVGAGISGGLTVLDSFVRGPAGVFAVLGEGEAIEVLRSTIEGGEGPALDIGQAEDGASVVLGDVTIRNSASTGSIAGDFAVLEMSRLDVHDNGGGLEVSDNTGDLALLDSAFHGNGGLALSVSGDAVTLSGVAFYDNDEAAAIGGETLTIENATFSGNAWGLRVGASVGGTIRNVTVAGGHEHPLVFDFGSGDSPISLANLVVADACDPDDVVSGAVASVGGNLATSADCPFDHPTDQVVADLKLGPLSDNGGPTPTQALLAGSPAVGAAVQALCPERDQRGYLRSDGDCDSGAFEAGATACTDADGDGYYAEGGACGPTDCNDANAGVHPGATEIPGNAVDENCDGSVLCGAAIGSGGPAPALTLYGALVLMMMRGVRRRGGR